MSPASEETMRAVVMRDFGGPEVLRIEEVPRPRAAAGEVLLRVQAFGLNRSELHFRRGMGAFGSIPRIPGIEAVGVVVEAPGGEIALGTRAVAMMGGMGRTRDGGYAEYLRVPLSSVIAVDTQLDAATLGAIPEMLQTAHGSWAAVGPAPGAPVLIRGGTSSVGLALAVLARRRGHRVLSTTRSAERAELLHAAGVDDVVIDDGHIAPAVRELVPGGVGGAVELVGTPTLPDTLAATAPGATVCFTGMLSDTWTIPDFEPMAVIPNGVRLTVHSGQAEDLPAEVLQDFLDAVAAGEAHVPLGRVYALEEIEQAHRDLEDGTARGKSVVVLSEH